jgi:hypothetical protein
MLKKINELKKKRARLLKSLNSGRPLIASTLSEIRTRCGKPNCHCASGEKHLSYLLTRREKGKTKTTYVPVELVEKVKNWSGEYHRLKELVNEITVLGEEIVKRYVKSKKEGSYSL